MQQDGVTYELKVGTKIKHVQRRLTLTEKLLQILLTMQNMFRLTRNTRLSITTIGAIDESRTDILGPVALGTQISEYTPKAKDGYTF